jgi:Diguanylate cyclase, GGDEF domain
MTALVFIRQWHLMKDLAKSAKVLHYASVTDPLTGARNRRFFDAAIPGDASQVLRLYAGPARRRNRDLVLFLIDLDNFKDVNDCFAHNDPEHRFSAACRGEIEPGIHGRQWGREQPVLETIGPGILVSDAPMAEATSAGSCAGRLQLVQTAGKPASASF